MDRRSTSRARSSGRSGSEANDSEKVTLYLSGEKASEYQQRKSAEEVPENVAIKCDSEREVNSLKRKSVAVNQATCDNAAEVEEPTYAAVLKQSDKENTQPAETAASHKRMKMDPLHGEPVKLVVSKPPIPPKPDVAKAPSPPAASKSKKHVVSEAHNALTVQKLLAQNEQMRLEINELRTSLATERGAVRVLRAQNESDLRRSKTECKKLQEALSHQKRNSAAGTQSCATVTRKPPNRPEGEQQGNSNSAAASSGSSSNGGQQTQALHQLNLDVLKLNQELSALRETNKFLEEKIQISSEAERRKASDFRVQRDLYELRLTQLTKSAKSEIQRLLEELKSKDRNIGLLKKEILALQGAGGGGGASTATKKERKAAKNSAQQSQEMRKVREPEPCSGTVSKSTSHSSIQSSACEEELEQHNAEADRVAAELRRSTGKSATTTFCCKCSPAAAANCSTPETTTTTKTTSARVDERQQNTTNTVYCSNGSNIELGLDTTTCGDDSSNRSKPHESRTMEAHNDDESHRHASASSRLSEPSVLPRTTIMTTAIRQLSTVSDADSAISSAPASLSPQPTSCPNSPEVWRAHPAAGHDQQTLQSLRDQSQLAEIKLELDRMQAKYDLLSADYGKAKDQIDSLERELLETTQNARERAKLADRIEQLEQREESLLRESHELREQNELLEFRIIELEESHDKWSIRSNSSPATVGSSSSTSSGSSTEGHGTTKDVWTDTVDKHHHHHPHDPDDLIMGHHHHHHHHHHSERSDSGVTSPNSHHHLDDTRTSGVPSPCCDLSLLDQIPTDDVRKRIITMSKRACYDDEDKQCLLQILTLLNNLEALSQDHEIGVVGGVGGGEGGPGDEMSLEVAPVKYNYPFPESNPPKSLLVTSTPFKTTPANQQGKIVATVQPFNNTSTAAAPTTTGEPKSISIASIAETFGGMRKSCKWGSTSLQESGVFVDEMLASAGTQTELEDFPCLERTNAELCAEIEKLNKFRQKIEECSGGGRSSNNRVKNPVGVSLSLPAAESCEQRRLQYYVNRVEQLENKVRVYESSGDQQVRQLANRMQREIQLEGWVEQLSEKVGKLEDENERLEEERCELEEIENDTRLRLQRMEVDYEVMSQRNSELEMSKNQYQTKYQDARDSIMSLEELVLKCEERIFVLEETENELNDRIDLVLAFIPVLLVYNSWQLQEQMAATRRQFNAINAIPAEHIEYYESTNGDLQMRLNELMTREKELTQNIAELNRAYNETLENADNLWAQMEKEYKDKIAKCETVEANLKSKIFQLEERLSKDSEYAHERISHLEEAENSLKNRVSKLNKENKELIAKHAALLEEYTNLKEEYRKLQNYLRGPAAENLEKEKRKILTLEEELSHSTHQLKEVEASHRSELGQLRGQLMCASKELNHIEVTNSELREEVETLEGRIRELLTLRNADDERIKHLAEELQAKQAQIQQLQQQNGSNKVGGAGRSLAQELERPVKGSYSKLGYEIHPLSRRFPGDSDSSGSEDKIKFPVAKPTAGDAKEVKSLAETIILNAESRGIRTPKKSFVEEARSRFARWV
uniref:Putative pftaire-interacting factor 1a n=1 Tax=Culex tarsalis TaxID=7177 RepID=A0A1Q3FZD5_CULTA